MIVSNAIKTIYSRINVFLIRGNKRSIKAKKNILAGFVVKGLSILANMLLVPLTINYLNPTNYGIWITLSSIIGWFAFFDIGLGHGLRNKFAEALAKDDKELAKTYVSTTYALLSIIITTVFLLFLTVNPFLNWAKILNTPGGLENELNLLALIVFALFCIRFIFQLIGTILTADQKPVFADIFKLLGNLLVLILVFILTKTTNENLVYLGTIVSMVPVVVLAVSTMWFFNNDYKYYKPAIKYVKLKYARLLFGLGGKFFFIQISGVILYQSTNIIISQIFGPTEVTPYNIAFRYFSLFTIVFGIIVNPFWSAYTEAYTKKDFLWIKNMTNKLIKIWLVMVVGLLFMTLFADTFYKFWIGDKVHVPFLVSLFMGIFVMISSLGSIFVSVINGVGKINLQLYVSIFGTIVFVPLAVLLSNNTVLGISGIILSIIVVNSFGVVIMMIQYSRIMNLKTDGIWNK